MVQSILSRPRHQPSAGERGEEGHNAKRGRKSGQKRAEIGENSGEIKRKGRGISFIESAIHRDSLKKKREKTIHKCGVVETGGKPTE